MQYIYSTSIETAHLHTQREKERPAMLARTEAISKFSATFGVVGGVFVSRCYLFI